jgi:16S rRNA (cytidine1402-2'-O)-methyltransferase
VDLIAAEDTRHSARLLHHFDIDTPLVSYHDHSGKRDLERLLRHLRSGASLALISDAGTPLVSDPGYRLVEACHGEAMPVIPVPGVSAVTAALSVSGLPTDRFHFEGFLPAKAGQRSSRIRAMKYLESTLVMFESPRRLVSTLGSLVDELGDREATLCRELTKAHETIRRNSLTALLDWVRADANQLRGEAVLLVRGFQREAGDISSDAAIMLEKLASELPPRRAAAIVADLTGARARDLYQLLLQNED